MQSKFVDFIRDNNLVSASDKVLLGVSGGVDSMVMFNLFRKAGFNVSAAHCNFSLREDESDGDEELVAYECEINSIKLHRIRFDTESYAKEHKLSIQVAARNLRYSWFNKLCDEFGYAKIAIAHNRDDVAETLIFNLTRGTGLKGLSGIKAVNGNVIRPLLFASRDEVTRYAIQNSVSFRNDSSNASIKYARNRIRHKVIPELEQINPSAKKSIAETAKHVNEAWNLVDDYLINLKDKLVKHDNNRTLFEIHGLSNEKYNKLFLFEELSSFGFSYETLEQVVSSIHGQSGKVFYSSTHQILRDRDFFILTEKKDCVQSIVQISYDCTSIEFPIRLSIRLNDNSDSFKIPSDSNIAVIDADKLSFPLTLRPWQPGDRFMPFGMNKFKKVSDFLIDQKISLVEKDQIYVLLSNNEIVWVVGKRVDDRFKITPETKSIWQLTFNKS